MNIEKVFTEGEELSTKKRLKSSQEGPGLAYKFSGQFCSSTPQAGVSMLPGSNGARSVAGINQVEVKKNCLIVARVYCILACASAKALPIWPRILEEPR